MAEDKGKNVLLVAASIIAAVRLAKYPIENSAKVLSTVADSVRLAKMIKERLERE